MRTLYTTVWGDTLAQIAAATGADPRTVAAENNLVNWHNFDPLPPGTAVVVPFFPVPQRVIVASGKVGDPRGAAVDPRSPLADPAAVVVKAQAAYLPLPQGV